VNPAGGPSSGVPAPGAPPAPPVRAPSNGPASTSPLPGRAALAAIAALAAVLGLLDLGGTGLWLDESLSAIRASLPTDELVRFLVAEPHQMKLYVVLLRGWRLLGEGELALRSLSVLFSVAAVVAIHAVGTRLYDGRTGLLAALVLALNGFHLRYAREARAYSLAVFLVLAGTLLLLALLRRGASPARAPRGRWLPAAYGAVSGLAPYAYSFTVFVNAAQAAALLVLPRRSVPWRSLALSALVAGVVVLPLAVQNLQDVGGENWGWIPEPTPRAVLDLFLHLTGYAGWPALLAYGVLALAALAEPRAGRRNRRNAAPAGDGPPGAADPAFSRFRRALLVAWVVVPVGIVLAISYVKPFLVPRYLIVCVPPLVLLAARGLALVRRPVPFALALAAFLWTAWPGIEITYRKPWEEDARGAASYVLSRAREGDGILFYGGSGVAPFDWYRRRAGVGPGEPPRTLFPAGAPLAEVLESLPDGVSRVWLVLSYVPAGPGEAYLDQVLDPRLRASYPSVREAGFPRIRVRLYAQPSARSP
jgi:hypothetical protein